MPARRNALGRGLDALIPSARPDPATPSTEPGAPSPDASSRATPPGVASREPGAEASRVGQLELPVDAIGANPEQPRRVFDDQELTRLADSIRRHGVLQPIVVRRAPDGADREYELVVGERRWRASQLAQRETIPATVQDVAPRDLLEVALIENVQRADLNPIELAMAFQALHEEGATQEEVGRRVGLDRSTIANHLRLLELPRELQGDVETGAITMGHAKALLSVTNPERRRHLRDRIVAEQISVRAAEELARQASGARKKRLTRPKVVTSSDPNLSSLIDAMRERLQTQVRIQGTAVRGRIEIDFYGAEDLHRVSQAILNGTRL
ncbi:MAG: chromosome partitioning protein ParB [Deltaproteobacteria bacterium]|nr:chromosome partitioning protein ParB [Deltaproteobacteria bacterium]